MEAASRKPSQKASRLEDCKILDWTRAEWGSRGLEERQKDLIAKNGVRSEGRRRAWRVGVKRGQGTASRSAGSESGVSHGERGREEAAGFVSGQ